MKNLKKCLAALTVTAMLVTSMATPVVAATTTTDASSFAWDVDADVLHELGLYQGTGVDPKVFVKDLDKTVDRQSAVIMVLRLFGQEEAAKELSQEEAMDILKAKLTDATDVKDWAARQLAYAVENGYVHGYPDGSFKPNKSISAKEYIALILQNLKQKFDFEKGPSVLSTIGGLDEADVTALGDESPVNRDGLVGISIQTLKAKYAEGTDKDKTVIEKLLELKTVPASAVEKNADKYGWPTVKPTVTPIPTASASVTSATAINGEITAVLDSAPATAPVDADFTVTQAINGAAATSVAGTVYWTAATKTAVVKVPAVTATSTLQKVVYTVAYKGGKAVTTSEVMVVNGFQVANVEALNSDNTAATLAGATGVKTDINVKVTFGAPVLETAVNPTNFQMIKVADNTVLPVKVTLSDDKKVVTMIPTSSMTANADYKVVVSSAVTAKDGSKLAAASTTTFKTGDFVTFTKFTTDGVVVDTTVVKGIFSKHVVVNKDFELTVPTNLNPNTVNGTNVKLLEKSGRQVPGIPTYDDTNKIVHFKLGESIGTDDAKLDYIFTAKGLKTSDGKDVENFSYSFTVSKDYAPSVQLSNGDYVDGTQHDASAVYGRLVTENYAGTRKVGFNLKISFREQTSTSVTNEMGDIQPMQADTLNENNVWLEESATGTKVASTLSYDAGNCFLTLTPNTDLKENTQYRIVVLPDVRNSFGLKAEAVNFDREYLGGSGSSFGINSGSSKYQSVFTTGYYARPAVASTSIAQGAGNVDANQNTVVVRFNNKLGVATNMPSAATLISNKAVKFIDNSVSDEEIDLGTGSGDNAATLTINSDTLTLQFTGGAAAAGKDGIHADGSFWGLYNKNGKIGSKAFSASVAEQNRKGHTFTLLIAGEGSQGANALRDEHGNTIADDYKLTFTVPAKDTVSPEITSILVNSNGAGTSNTNYDVTLSKSDTVTNVLGEGDSVANEKIKIIYNKEMDTAATATRKADYYTLYKYNYTNSSWDVVSNPWNADATVAVTNPSSDKETFILTPASTATIQDLSKYKLVISQNVTDKSGNKMDSDQTVTFTTGAGPNFNSAGCAPTVADTNAQGFDTDGNAAALKDTKNLIKIMFTAPGDGVASRIDASTLSTDYITVADAAVKVVTGTLYNNYDKKVQAVTSLKTVYFAPDSTWESGKTYTVTAKKGIKDATLGNVSTKDKTYQFTVGEAGTAPTVVLDPVVDNSTGVLVDSAFQVKFSANMKAGTSDGSVESSTNVKLFKDSTSGTEIPAELKYNKETYALTITPKNYLASSTKYAIQITTNCKSDATTPVALAKSYTYTFGTSTTSKTATIVEAKWRVTNTTTGDGNLELTFDRPVDTDHTTFALTSFKTNSTLTAASSKTIAFVTSSDHKTVVVTNLDSGSVMQNVTWVRVATNAEAGANEIAAYSNGVSSTFDSSSADSNLVTVK